MRKVKVAIVGCAHGELDMIYNTISEAEKELEQNVELLLICGDFQAVRFQEDLHSMSVPDKYKRMADFNQYFSGRKRANVLTIVIGGNHEASSYMETLHFGGWLADNIYYLGRSGVVNYKGLRIAGVSGIYKASDYHKGHHEKIPYNENTVRSVYHTREYDILKLSNLKSSLDVFLSHDWPKDISAHGNQNQLLKAKPFFRSDIESGELGSPPLKKLLHLLKPQYWFSAHLHVKFAALVTHQNETCHPPALEDAPDEKRPTHAQSATKFLALDKCVPGKKYMQFLDMTLATAQGVQYDAESLCYDLEWLAIVKSYYPHFPSHQFSKNIPERLSSEELKQTSDYLMAKLAPHKFKIPLNFQADATGISQHQAFMSMLELS